MRDCSQRAQIRTIIQLWEELDQRAVWIRCIMLRKFWDVQKKAKEKSSVPSRSRCLFLIWLMAALSCGQAQVIAITHARLLDGTGTPAVDDATILIEGKTIKAVGRSDLKIPAGAHVIDAKGKTAIPGLADMHVHLTGGWDGEATDILGYQTYLNALLYSGVTTVLDTGNIPPLILQLRGAVASGILQGPRIYCVGPLVEGPDPIWGPISLVMTSKAQIPSVIAQLKSENVDLVKLYAGLSDQLVRGISAEAKKQGLRTIIDQGHRNGSMDLMDEGIAGFAHLPSHRISDETVLHAKESGIFFISTLILGEMFSQRRLKDLKFLGDPLIADVTPPSQLKALQEMAEKPIDAAEEQRRKNILAQFQGVESNVKRLWDAGVLIAAGTDAPYPGDFQGEGLHRELELLVESGLTPLQALTAATKNAATIVGADREWGTLEAGKLANVLLIDGKPDQNIHDTHQIFLLIKQGDIVDREKLKFSPSSKDFATVRGAATQ
jgi:imidazolonepropionase-like amidohydrolase